MRRRPFFLLEVVVATILIGAFAFLSIRGSFKAIGKEYKQLETLKVAMQADLDRMEVIQECWNKVESISKQSIMVKSYQVKCEIGRDGTSYLLTVKFPKGEKYHYLVKRE